MQPVITWIVLVACGIGVVGCSPTPRPTVYAYPQQGQTAEQQSRDTAECQNWAYQQTGYAPSGTARGAGVGGLVGALGGAAAGAAIGAATGGGSGAAQGAAIGAAAGGVGGAVTGGASAYTQDRQGYNRAFAACMQGRGYYVR